MRRSALIDIPDLMFVECLSASACGTIQACGYQRRQAQSAACVASLIPSTSPPKAWAKSSRVWQSREIYPQPYSFGAHPVLGSRVKLVSLQPVAYFGNGGGKILRVEMLLRRVAHSCFPLLTSHRTP